MTPEITKSFPVTVGPRTVVAISSVVSTGDAYRTRGETSMTAFAERVRHLPVLGLGISTEYGAATAPAALDPLALRAAYPAFAAFLEIGVEVVKGIDDTAQQWVHGGWPTTYHFLDLNLDEAEDFDAPWLSAAARLADQMQPAWLCGDAGLWHFGRRERGHMLLLPPILCAEAARQYAAGILRLRAELGYEVLPENPPGQVYLGPWHLLEFYADVAERADTGVVLDCAHLAMYQQLMGHPPCTGLEGFPLERIVELHVAGKPPRHTRALRIGTMITHRTSCRLPGKSSSGSPRARRT